MSVEPSRRHGPFDTRWPTRHSTVAAAVRSAPLLRPAEAAARLDWDAFSSRYFPACRRHDLGALSDYAAFKHGREGRQGGPARLTLVPNDPDLQGLEDEFEPNGTKRLLAAVAAIRAED
jgi:hypothetical protein